MQQMLALMPDVAEPAVAAAGPQPEDLQQGAVDPAHPEALMPMRKQPATKVK